MKHQKDPSNQAKQIKNIWIHKVDDFKIILFLVNEIQNWQVKRNKILNYKKESKLNQTKWTYLSFSSSLQC